MCRNIKHSYSIKTRQGGIFDPAKSLFPKLFRLTSFHHHQMPMFQEHQLAEAQLSHRRRINFSSISPLNCIDMKQRCHTQSMSLLHLMSKLFRRTDGAAGMQRSEGVLANEVCQSVLKCIKRINVVSIRYGYKKIAPARSAITKDESNVCSNMSK